MHSVNREEPAVMVAEHRHRAKDHLSLRVHHHDRNHAQNRDHNLGLNHVRRRALSHDRNRDHNLGLNRVHHRALSRDRNLGLNHVHHRALSRDRNRDHNHAQSRSHSRVLNHALNQDRNRDREIQEDRNNRAALNLVRATQADQNSRTQANREDRIHAQEIQADQNNRAQVTQVDDTKNVIVAKAVEILMRLNAVVVKLISVVITNAVNANAASIRFVVAKRKSINVAIIGEITAITRITVKAIGIHVITGKVVGINGGSTLIVHALTTRHAQSSGLSLCLATMISGATLM